MFHVLKEQLNGQNNHDVDDSTSVRQMVGFTLHEALRRRGGRGRQDAP